MDFEQLGSTMLLELEDGTTYTGYNFGAERKSISGELVFQTGMVGYPESITDPSYRGQILVLTFPLVGNYGVPSRETGDKIVQGLSAHFEANQIHIAGLVVASYSGEDYSHHLATSSLGNWLKEQGIPAIQGIDTRALTKKIREKGSMLGKLLAKRSNKPNGLPNGDANLAEVSTKIISLHKYDYQDVQWVDPNKTNLVAEGLIKLPLTLACHAVDRLFQFPHESSICIDPPQMTHFDILLADSSAYSVSM